MSDKCKGCGAEINWIKTSKGKSMPVDPEMTTIITMGGVIYKGFIPHWATCPESSEFKKGKEHTPGLGSMQWQCSALSGCGAWNLKGRACKCGAQEPVFRPDREKILEGGIDGVD